MCGRACVCVCLSVCVCAPRGGPRCAVAEAVLFPSVCTRSREEGGRQLEMRAVSSEAQRRGQDRGVSRAEARQQQRRKGHAMTQPLDAMFVVVGVRRRGARVKLHLWGKKTSLSCSCWVLAWRCCSCGTPPPSPPQHVRLPSATAVPPQLPLSAFKTQRRLVVLLVAVCAFSFEVNGYSITRAMQYVTHTRSYTHTHRQRGRQVPARWGAHRPQRRRGGPLRASSRRLTAAW